MFSHVCDLHFAGWCHVELKQKLDAYSLLNQHVCILVQFNFLHNSHNSDSQRCSRYHLYESQLFCLIVSDCAGMCVYCGASYPTAGSISQTPNTIIPLGHSNIKKLQQQIKVLNLTLNYC